MVSGSLPPGIGVDNLTQLVKSAQRHGLRCIIDSSGEALAAALDVGNIELVKPNQKSWSALVGRDLKPTDDVRRAAEELIRSGKVRRVVVSLGPQVRWGRCQRQCTGRAAADEKPKYRWRRRQHGRRNDPAPAEDASLEDMVRFGVAAGSAATINRVPVCARWKTRTKSILTCAVAGSSSAGAGVAKSSSWSMLKIPWITTG